MNMCYCVLEYGSKDLFGCLRKEGHKGEHLSYLEFSGFKEWERDWDCNCDPEEGCRCSSYSEVTPKEAEKIIFSDFGKDVEHFPELLKNSIKQIQELGALE